MLGILDRKKYWASVLKESLTNQIQENITESTIFENWKFKYVLRCLNKSHSIAEEIVFSLLLDTQ